MSTDYAIESRVDRPVARREKGRLTGDLYLPRGEKALPAGRTRTSYGQSVERVATKGQARTAMGRAADEPEWPLMHTQWQPWYLHSGGGADSVLGDGTLAPALPQQEPGDRLVYDSPHPLQTRDGAGRCEPSLAPWGACDRRGVLCYTSEPLAQDLEVTGPIRAVLHAATDGADTAWTVKLVDLWPNGDALPLCHGILRARFWASFDAPQQLTSGTVYEYSIDVGTTGHVFGKGHRIGVEISSSNVPRDDRHFNGSGAAAANGPARPIQQTVYHDAARPSHILLPVIPARG